MTVDEIRDAPITIWDRWNGDRIVLMVRDGEIHTAGLSIAPNIYDQIRVWSLPISLVLGKPDFTGYGHENDPWPAPFASNHVLPLFRETA